MKMASTTAAVKVKVEEFFIVSPFFDSILSAGFRLIPSLARGLGRHCYLRRALPCVIAFDKMSIVAAL